MKLTAKEVKNFTSHVQEQMESLNTLEDIEITDPVLVSIEIQARQLAYSKLKAILEPILSIKKGDVKFNKKEYIV